MSATLGRARLTEAVDLIQRETLGAVLAVLENGGLLGEGMAGAVIPFDYRERLRTLRTRLLEADLYELLYDALPANAVDPLSARDPWSVPVLSRRPEQEAPR